MEDMPGVHMGRYRGLTCGAYNCIYALVGDAGSNPARTALMNIVSGNFEWDSEKNRTNAEKHGLTFEDAIEVFSEPYLRVRSNRFTETRFVALGKAKGRVIAVIYTERSNGIRVISARMARADERGKYQDRIGDIS
jgi:uncharacterized DUF497 family protein